MNAPSQWEGKKIWHGCREAGTAKVMVYRPLVALTDAVGIPESLEAIALAKRVIQRPNPNRRLSTFSGERYTVKTAASPVGPGPIVSPIRPKASSWTAKDRRESGQPDEGDARPFVGPWSTQPTIRSVVEYANTKRLCCNSSRVRSGRRDLVVDTWPVDGTVEHGIRNWFRNQGITSVLSCQSVNRSSVND